MTRTALAEQRLRPATAMLPTVQGYEIERELGRGGMGVVYLARQVSLNRPVALKMILAGAHASLEELLRFRSEAGAAARFQHPNIVQIYEVGEQTGQPYLTLEYVPGGSLADKLSGTPVTTREAAELVETLARAVHYAHSQGVLHRDLKPANVLLTADGSPKITDFGLATHLDAGARAQARTQTGAVLGTPSYMAPEQASGESRHTSAATDVYALGAILYELLTGRPPFRAATHHETLRQVVEDEPAPPSRLQRSAVGDLETICLKCLRKEPGKRYETAGDLAEDLRRFRAGESILARPTGRVEQFGRWCRRNPRVAALLALLVVVFLAGFAGVAVQWRRAERQRVQTEENYRFARRVVSDYFAVLGNDPLLDHSGALALRQELLETALAHFQDPRLNQENDPDLQINLARGWYCLGRLRAHAGPEAEAAEPFRRAITIQEELVRNQPDRADLRSDLARSYDGLARVEVVLNHREIASEFQQKALAIRELLHSENPRDPERRYDLAASWAAIAYFERSGGQADSGLALLKDAERVFQELVREQPQNLVYQAGLNGTLNDLGLTLHHLKRYREALAVFDIAIERQTLVFEQAPQAARYRHLISVHYFNKARYALLPLNEPAKAAAAARHARRLNPEDPHNLWRVARVLALASAGIDAGNAETTAAERRRCADDALDALADAITFGLEGEQWLGNPDLKALTERPEFHRLLAKVKERASLARK